VEIIRAGLASDVDCALVTLLAYVGLRPQEALAAVWSDMVGDKLVVDAAKTGRTRVIPLLPVVRMELAELRLRRGRPVPAAPLIATSFGEAWSESRFRSFRRHRWSKVAPGLRPYDLRHAYVSLMIQAGHTVVEVARWAGHSPQVCLSTYAHLFDTVSERIDPDLAIRRARYGTGANEERAAGWACASGVHRIRLVRSSAASHKREKGAFCRQFKVRALLAQLVEHFHGKRLRRLGRSRPRARNQADLQRIPPS
jgi:integrase-like protein